MQMIRRSQVIRLRNDPQIVKQSIRLMIGMAVLFLASCNHQSQQITWDIYKGTKPEDLGWHPSGLNDREFTIRGDLDFTLREHSDTGRISEFHQKCTSISISRNVIPPNVNSIQSIVVYFGQDITVDQGITLAKRVLTEWGGGLREDLPRGEISLDQIRERIKSGVFQETQFSGLGREGGVVKITVTGNFERPGLERTCSLLFYP
jgi:hypothetical protein